MIVDLQGKETLLSDPTFHTQPKSLFEDETNHGKDGIKTFFSE